MQNSTVDNFAKEINISSSSHLNSFLPLLLQKQLFLKLDRHKFTNLFQGICGILEGSNHRILLIMGGYLDKNNLPVLCNLLCGLWQLVLLWPCSHQSFAGAGNAFEWNSWKNEPVGSDLSLDCFWFPCAPADIQKLMISYCSFLFDLDNCRVFTAKHFWKILIT